MATIAAAASREAWQRLKDKFPGFRMTVLKRDWLIGKPYDGRKILAPRKETGWIDMKYVPPATLNLSMRANFDRHQESKSSWNRFRLKPLKRRLEVTLSDPTSMSQVVAWLEKALFILVEAGKTEAMVDELDVAMVDALRAVGKGGGSAAPLARAILRSNKLLPQWTGRVVRMVDFSRKKYVQRRLRNLRRTRTPAER